ncbi:dienelactone hydrolase family protein [Azospirillum halopraeferens]|uniref:dienelactone hydrolase family protein n=1 Tax=Azospirillum halopraeferens TaxID=34010 RepID=UPI0004222B53|nr:dienelactone hydrolase family protein [Azospirillum halopraeferens]
MADPHTVTSAPFEYADGSTLFEGYAAYDPSTAGPLPCVLVCHDWSGLNAPTREIAGRFAASGRLAVALDAYGKGVRGDVRGDNAALMNPLLADRGLLRRRLLAGLRAAVRHPRADAGRVAVVGHCFGGLCALDLARAAPPGLRGAVSIHGVLTPPDLGAQPTITAAVLILHGWEDPVAPPADVLTVARELTDAGADWQLHAYGHARHAFTFRGLHRPDLGLAYDARADHRSRRALDAFLDETLGGDGRTGHGP